MWENRICGHADVPPESLTMHGQNWRIHNDKQRRVLQAMLDKVGFVKSITVSKRTNVILDGHLRVSLAIANNAATVPVEYVDVTPTEEAEILATVDPVGDLAGTDAAKLAELRELFETPDYDVDAMIDDLIGDFDPLDEDEFKPKGPKTADGLPEMELKPYEHYDILCVLATSTTEWNALAEKFGLQRVKVSREKGAPKVGVMRAIKASRLLEMLK
jgi:hypothetical protein